MPSANGLDKPPPGYVWLEAGRTARLIATGDGVDHEQAAAERAAMRRAAEEYAREKQAVAEREARIAERVAQVLAAGDVAYPDARAALIGTLDRIEAARLQHARTVQKHNAHLAAVNRLDDAKAALTELEASVRSHFTAYAEYGAGTVRPNERVQERAALQQRVNDAQWRHDLSATANGDGLQVDVAANVITSLQDRLPAARNAILRESALPICQEVQRLAAALEAHYRVLHSLGEAISTRGQRPVIKCALPPLPHGVAALEVSASAADVAMWRKGLAALAEDPTTLIEVPGAEPVPEVHPPVSFVRSVLKRALACEGVRT
jgi:hypothetical protein